MKKIVYSIDGDKWVLKQKNGGATMIDTGKLVSILPFNLENSILFLQKSNLIKN